MEAMDFEEVYRQGEIPWDHGHADFNLAETVERFSIAPCKALDLGCGLGNNLIWLAQNGFKASGFDLSETAVAQAKERLGKAGVECVLQTGDFLHDPVVEAPFGFVFDRGCLHCMDGAEKRKMFTERVAGILEPDGFWLSLIGNADELDREDGPPQMSVQEVAEAVESYFEIVSLTSGIFGDKQEDPPRAWVCFMKKRNPGQEPG